jgi:valine dehydrogenase (NAD+)
MAGLPFGGAKGVVINTPNMNKNAAFQRYAEIVEELRGLFKTGTDVGIYDTDVVHMAQFTSHMLGVVPGDRGDMSTSSIAALGVYYSVRASLAHRYGNDNPKGVSIGVKGVGKLGGELVRLLYADGALLTVADVDTNRCKEIVAAYPGRHRWQAGCVVDRYQGALPGWRQANRHMRQEGERNASPLCVSGTAGAYSPR